MDTGLKFGLKMAPKDCCHSRAIIRANYDNSSEVAPPLFTEAEIRTVFQRFDSNGDSHLDKKELKKGLKA
ncbi:hypothetical protein PTKIN_Ptkin08bG0014100 [Pterospermum kingtungense]